ncbi:type I polyketide synthase [Kutzneria sp. CA-103260]|uniref:type I polyketide synthase n=1 Tax=Kutzneria sp. CA-103260 TaxID=2802641 RepID=UPI001BA78221|nr:type I polyketide synthase [Kutzneria sp. CA-103260]QUQ64257.1 type I polyketide synthase [Kutzneria sp. CA-103260]
MTALPLLLTGRTAADVDRYAVALARHLDGAEVRVADVGRSLLAAAGPGPHRAVVLAGEHPADAARSLRKLTHRVPAAEVVTGSGHADGKLAFVFPGQGSHRLDMCRPLYERFPAYAKAFDEVATQFAPLLDVPMQQVVFSGQDISGDLLKQPRYAHAAMFAVEYALVALLAEFGVRPDVVGGYSGGEDVAACVAGMVGVADMCRLIVARALAIEQLAPPGGMLAVQATLAEVTAVLSEDVHIAGFNGPRSLVVAGPDDSLERVAADLAERFSARSRRVLVDNPFHTPYLHRTVTHFTGNLGAVDCAPPTLPFVSSVTGGLIDHALDVGEHWGRHFEQPVLFASVVETMLDLGVTTFLEVGPGGTLTAMVHGVLGDQARQRVVPLLRRNFRDDEALLTALAELRVRGLDADFSCLFADATVIPLPDPADAPAGAMAFDPTAVVDGHVAAVLGLPELTARHRAATFQDLGFDSVTAVELRHRVNASTELDLPLTVVFDHPTPAALAEHVRGLLLGESDGETETVAAPADDDPVVIVGMACRLPGGVDSPAALWQLLVDETDAITTPPANRGWASDHWQGGFLADAGDFDAAFFDISADEALTMDPQQRLLLETTWAGVEDAGIDPRRLRGTDMGVFVGGMVAEYGPRLRHAAASPVPPSLTGTLGSVLSGRIAYALGFTGPSLTVDTACSSSLVALHLAAAAVRAGECALAVAGGVTVMPDDGVLAEFARQGGLAADGRCKAFSDDADGTGFAEGVGVLVLQRRSAALRDGRRILAVVRGSAINSDGASNGLTAPNGRAQQRVIRRALRRGGLAPSDVDVVEAHGTGTRLGDPIEAQALQAVYGGADRPEPLLIGSVKSNIGHTQAAAGVAGVIKMVLAMRHGVLPATLHVSAPATAVSWSGVRPAVTATPWPETGRPRRAGVSSFGISGTNAHVVLEQGSESPNGTGAAGVVPWLLSARSEAALRGQARRLAAVDADPVDVGWSLATERTAFEHRAVVLAAEHGAGLTALAAGEGAPGLVLGRADEGGLAVVFAGQGSQRPGMGAALARRFPVFDAALREVLHHLPDAVAAAMGDGELLARTEYAQPALFALEVALFRLIESFGVRPDFVAGHSVGEIAAAHVAGVLSLPDAARLVAERGRLMQQLPPGGAMAAVEAALSEVEPLLPPSVVVAAVNGPSSVVVAGPEPAVRETLTGLRGKQLRVSHAFHSPLVDPVLHDLAAVAADLKAHPAAIPVVSTVTGKRIDEELASPAYWVEHARRPVLFADAVDTLRANGVRTFLEAGPDRSLSALIGGDAVPLLGRDGDEESAALTALAELHVRGVDVDFTPLLAGGRSVSLPTYAFDRRTYWLSDTGAVTLTAGAAVPGLADELAATPEDERPDLILALVRRELGFVLPGHTELAADRPFKDFGMDSLAAVRMRDRLAAATGIVLPATAAYDCPTPRALATHLLDRLSAEARPADAVLRRLDEVAAGLPAALEDRADRARVRAQLTALLARVDEPADAVGEAFDPASVSTEELFDLIDREFEGL